MNYNQIEKQIKDKKMKIEILQTEIRTLESQIITKKHAEEIISNIFKVIKADVKDIIRALRIVYPNQFESVVKEC